MGGGGCEATPDNGGACGGTDAGAGAWETGAGAAAAGVELSTPDLELGLGLGTAALGAVLLELHDAGSAAAG
jgi:hypothetical protein